MFPGNSEAPWLSLMGPHSFSAAEASRLQPDWYELWLLTLHLCGVNLAMSGVTISLLAWFGLRERVAWASRILLVLILWVVKCWRYPIRTSPEAGTKFDSGYR